MKLSRRFPCRSTAWLTATVFVLVTGSAAAQRSPVYPVIDGHGYLAWDQSSPICAAAFSDISATGTIITFTAVGSDPTLDEGGAVITLVEPFELYGTPITSLVVSTNGYLAAAGDLTADAGGDFSNDCPLPAVPEEGPSTTLRIAVLHDDLDGTSPGPPAPGGIATHQYFPSCPRPSDALGAESCTIVQWSDWRVIGSSATFDIQSVLYHQSFETAIQFSGDDYTARPKTGDPHGATIGLQNPSAGIGLTAACDLRSHTMAGSAFCLFDPRFPPAIADLWAELDEKVDLVTPGGQLEYTLTAVNPGPGIAGGTSVSLSLPPEITDCAWSCTATPGSTCTATGSGLPFSDTVNLQADAAAYYELLCDLDPSAAGGTVVATATVGVPAGFHDPDLTNNIATATTGVPIPVTLQSFTIE